MEYIPVEHITVVEHVINAVYFPVRIEIELTAFIHFNSPFTFVDAPSSLFRLSKQTDAVEGINRHNIAG